MDGGIFRLLGLIRDHRGAVEYDWRTRFALGLRDIDGETMTLPEAGRLATQLLADPSSAIHAAAAGWPHPMSIEALIAADQFDLNHLKTWAEGGKKGPKPKGHWLRPVTEDDDVQRFGNTGGRTREEVVAILNAMGHSLS